MRIGIIGFGFSGSMVATHLVRAAQAPLTLYLIDPECDARGVAYRTTNPDHLLNVPAHNMSAFADAPEDFVRWLSSADAATSKGKLGITRDYLPTDFVPRALYGAYLNSLWRATQALAAQKKLAMKLVPSRAVAVQAGGSPAILTERGDAIAVDCIVLAVGHEGKSIFPQISSSHLIQNPWAEDTFADAAHWPSPVLLMGTGLTAVDMVLSLRQAGYAGEILATSRHCLLPQAHAKPPSPALQFPHAAIASLRTLRQYVRFVRHTIREQGGDWRVVVDGLRPHTQTLWQRLSPRDKQRFLTHLLPLWSTHRHRMAPEIAARIAAEMAAGTLRFFASPSLQVGEENGQLSITAAEATPQPAGRILNATGLELNLARSRNPLLRQLLESGVVEVHPTALGIATDPHHRAWGGLHPQLFALGSLLTGQLLESTAVPELRVQAAKVAQGCLGL